MNTQDVNTFDNNTWYQINWKYGNSLTHSPLYVQFEEYAYGSAYLSPYDWMRWQFIPYPQNNSQYSLRPGELGAGGCFAAAQKGLVDASCQNDCSETGPFVTNRVDASSYWTITAWDDGSYAFSNSANGTNWLLSVDNSGPGSGSWLNMAKSSSNQSLAAWDVSSVGPINNIAYSTVSDCGISNQELANDSIAGSVSLGVRQRRPKYKYDSCSYPSNYDMAINHCGWSQ